MPIVAIVLVLFTKFLSTVGALHALVLVRTVLLVTLVRAVR